MRCHKQLVHKAWQSRSGHVAGGALVWFEEFFDMRSTLRREQQIRRAAREWQVKLIEQFNAAWIDLYQTLLPDPSFVHRASAA